MGDMMNPVAGDTGPAGSGFDFVRGAFVLAFRPLRKNILFPNRPFPCMYLLSPGWQGQAGDFTHMNETYVKEKNPLSYRNS